MTSELNDLKREFCWAEQYSDFDKLEELSDKMLEIDPNLTEYKKQLISLYFYADEYEKCVKKYNRYIREFGEINDEDFDYFMALSYATLRVSLISLIMKRHQSYGWNIISSLKTIQGLRPLEIVYLSKTVKTMMS